jgi:hypothetical protein
VVLGGTRPAKGQALAQQLCLARSPDHEVLEDFEAFHALLTPVLHLQEKTTNTSQESGSTVNHKGESSENEAPAWLHACSICSTRASSLQAALYGHVLLGGGRWQPHHIVEPIIDEDVAILTGGILVLPDHSDGDAQLNVAHLPTLIFNKGALIPHR